MTTEDADGARPDSPGWRTRSAAVRALVSLFPLSPLPVSLSRVFVRTSRDVRMAV